MISQRELDDNRRTYSVSFPSELGDGDVLNWLRQIGSTLHTRSTFRATPTLVFETLATDRDIKHYLTIPWQDADYIVGQLHGLVPGINVSPAEHGRPVSSWEYAEDFDLTRADEAVNVPAAGSLSTSILLTLGGLEVGESVLMQWIISPLGKRHATDKQLATTEFELRAFRYGDPRLDPKAIAAKRAKLEEPNFLACLRIAGNGSTPLRAEHLVANAYRPMRSLGRFKRAVVFNRQGLIQKTATATSPKRYGAKLSANELVPLLTWPIGNQMIPGLPRGAARHLPASELIPREGRLIGSTTLPGRERPVALDYVSSLTHTFIGGGTGVGKTTLMANLARQDMENGHGVVVIEPKGDLFHEVMNNVPQHRRKDVIAIDFTNGLRPVGFNILDQGNPRTVVDELVDLFQYKYKDNGVWFRELMFHGLLTLAATPGLTFNDLRPLVAPKTPEEEQWSKDTTQSAHDRELTHFWARWWGLTQDERNRYSQSLENRIWQLISRIEPRYLFGQSTSSFKMDDVVRNNQILLINLAGIPKESKEIVGTLLFNALWTSAQNVPTDKSNFVYMDEFQMFADIPMGLDDVLALARKYKLGMVAATQYVERLPSHLQQAVKANMRNKIILNSSEESASIWSREFGQTAVASNDIINLPAYTAVARINTPDGMSTPFTLKTMKPPMPYNSRHEVARLSMEQHGRSIKDIEAAEVARRARLQQRRKVEDAPIERRRKL